MVTIRRAAARTWRWWRTRGGRAQFGWILLILSLVGWPISAVTWARHEPQTVLGLSWGAITLTALDILLTAQVHKIQDDSSTVDS
jgi:hypothetical protein